VSIHLEVVSLDDNPEYDALSYAWGDPTVTCEIELNGVQWPVTTNLAAGLPRLRHSKDTAVLWIDAICIDQANVKE
jgi:hypothetical protein